MDLFELVQAETLQQIYDNDTNRPPYIGLKYFPNMRVKGLKFSFIKGKQGAPVALVGANFNTNVLFRDRIGVEKISATLPLFKEAMSIDEELRQEILSTKDEYAGLLKDRVFDDLTELMDGADVTAERMRQSLLSTGTITIQENGVDKQYDYGFDEAKQFKTEATLWSAEKATPLASMYEQVDKFKTENPTLTPVAITMDITLFNKLRKDKSIIEHFSKLLTPDPYPTSAKIKTYVESVLEIPLEINDKRYLEARDFGGTPKAFYPEDRYTIIASPTLGDTLYGTTPEEADLLGNYSKASSCAVTENGIAITTWNEVDPVNVNTKVSEVVVPSCPQIDKIRIVKVL